MVFYSKIQNNHDRSQEVQTSLRSSVRVLYFTVSELLFRLELEDNEIRSVLKAVVASFPKIEQDGVVKLAGARLIFHLSKNIWIVDDLKGVEVLQELLDFVLQKMTEYTSSEDRKYLVKAACYLFLSFSKFEDKLCLYVQSKLDSEGVIQSNIAFFKLS